MNFFQTKRTEEHSSAYADEGVIIVEANEKSSVPGEIDVTTSFQNDESVEQDAPPVVIVPGADEQDYGFKKAIGARSIYMDGIEVNSDELNVLSDDDLDELISNILSETNGDEHAYLPMSSIKTSSLMGEENTDVADLHDEQPVDFTPREALSESHAQSNHSLEGIDSKSEFAFETLSSIGRSQIVGSVEDGNLQGGALTIHFLQLYAEFALAITNYVCIQIWRGFKMLTCIFYCGGSLLSNLLAAISRMYQISTSIISTLTRVGNGVYNNTKAIFRRRVAGASDIEVGFMAGVFTTLFFVLTFWHLGRGTASAFNFAYANVTAIVDPFLRKVKMIRHIITQNALPVNVQAPVKEIAKPILNPFVSVNTAPIILSTYSSDIQDAVTMQKLEIIEPYHNPHSIITNQALERPDTQAISNTVMQQSNRSLTIDSPSDVFDAARFSMNTLIVFFTLAIAIIPAWVMPKGKVDKGSFEVKGIFKGMSRRELQVECKKRNLTPATLKEDMIRHLCLYDGIDHSFAVFDLAKYNAYTCADLQRFLKNLGGKTSGNKDDLQYRLAVIREALYMESSKEEMCDILEQSGLNINGEKCELARRLAEAGPSLPI